jgi:hypothetical protein
MPAPAFNFPNLPAPLSMLALLATAGLGLAITIAAVLALASGRRPWARRLFAAGSALAASYLAALVGFALVSREVTLPRGAEKYFCEIDCHLAYSVLEVQRSPALSGPPSAQGELWLVRLRARFDASTISARRARDLPLQPNPRRLEIVDRRGGRHLPIPLAGRGLPPGPPASDLMTPLRPGESYDALFLFDLPREAEAPRLLLTEAIPEARLLIDNETSYLHRRAYFSLAP